MDSRSLDSPPLPAAPPVPSSAQQEPGGAVSPPAEPVSDLRIQPKYHPLLEMPAGNTAATPDELGGGLPEHTLVSKTQRGQFVASVVKDGVLHNIYAPLGGGFAALVNAVDDYFKGHKP